MFDRLCIAAAFGAGLTLLGSASASAQGEIVITQAKANAGNVTPGDAPGFPVRLSLPGAYILGSNLQVPAGQLGIHAAVHNVDIDMNGFRLSGLSTSGVRVGETGLYSQYGQSRIHDGLITGFRLNGIYLVGNVNAWTVENMQIIQNGGSGVSADGSAYARFLHNNIVANGGAGIRCGDFCHVEGSTVSDNGADGIALRSGTVTTSSIFSNIGFGIYDAFCRPKTPASATTPSPRTIREAAFRPSVPRLCSRTSVCPMYASRCLAFENFPRRPRMRSGLFAEEENRKLVLARAGLGR